MGDKPLKRIAITGAAGQIAYSLLFQIANGDLLGHEVPIALHLLDIPEGVPSLKGVAMELQDCALSSLKEVKVGSDPHEVFGDIDYAFLIGAKPRGPGMERKDLLADNGKIFVSQAQALNRVAKRSVRVLVVGNPCNTNCLIALHHAPDLPFTQFHAMSRLDQNRAAFQLANKGGVSVDRVTNVAIWGNHSSTQVPDFFNAKINGRPALETISDRKWCEEQFIPLIQKRGAEVIAARGKSSAASAAHAALCSMKAILEPTREGDWFSACVLAKGNPYGIREDLVFSFPCRSKGKGDWAIVPHVAMDPFLEKKIALTEKELIEEREAVQHLLR